MSAAQCHCALHSRHAWIGRHQSRTVIARVDDPHTGDAGVAAIGGAERAVHHELAAVGVGLFLCDGVALRVIGQAGGERIGLEAVIVEEAGLATVLRMGGVEQISADLARIDNRGFRAGQAGHAIWLSSTVTTACMGATNSTSHALPSP